MKIPPRWPATAWAGVGVGVAVGAILWIYLVSGARHGFLPVSWDAFGYIWQTNAVGHASLSQLGTRPGVPLLAALLRSVLPMQPMGALVVLPIAMAAALGLGAAVCVRVGLRLPAWTLPVVAAAVGLWPGTARVLLGYEANLVLLLLLAAAVVVLVHARGRPAPLALAAGLFAAAALTHPVIFAAFAVVAVLWVLLSLRALARDRLGGIPLPATDAGGAVIAVGGGAVLGVATAIGLFGLRPSSVLHAQPVSFLFQGRAIEEVRRERPAVSTPLAALGAAATWSARLGARRRDDPGARPGRSLGRLAIAWLAVAGVGVGLSVRGRQIPGARFLLFALPAPVLVGLGVATVAGLIARRRSAWRVVLAGAIAALVIAGLAVPGWRYIRSQVSPLKGKIAGQLQEAGAYVAGLPSTTPVVVVVNEPGLAGAYSPKLRLNVIRSVMPAATAANTFVYVGDPANLLAGRPTLIDHPTLQWQLDYNTISRSTWAQAEPALRSGATVLILRGYDREGFDAELAQDPGRQVAVRLLVLRGAIQPVSVEGGIRGPGKASAVVATLWILAVVTGLGWGWAGVGLRGSPASRLDRLCLAPAVGAGAGVLTGLTVALAGLDPAGPAGVPMLVIVAMAGVVLDRRMADRTRPNATPAPARTAAATT